MSTIDVLKKSLVACGLPTSGNKEQMLARLLEGQPDKRKSKGKKPSTGDADGDAFKSFAQQERMDLVAKGMTDESDISEEIDRRWAVLQASKTPPKASSEDDAPTVTLPQKLPDAAATVANLHFVSQVPGGYMYLKAQPQAISKKVDAAAPKPKDKEKPKPAAKLGKRAEPEPDVAEDDEESDDLAWACEVSAMRILKKLKTPTINAMLDDFGMSDLKGQGKETVAKELGTQLHFETDDEDEE